MLAGEKQVGVVHRYHRKIVDGQKMVAVVWKRPDEGGVHLRAPYAGTVLKLTPKMQRQCEEMPEKEFQKLQQHLL